MLFAACYLLHSNAIKEGKKQMARKITHKFSGP